MFKLENRQDLNEVVQNIIIARLRNDKKIKKCRCCGSTKLETVFDLGVFF